MMVTIRNYEPGYSINARKIVEGSGTMEAYLGIWDVENARATVSDDFGNVVLAIDAGNGDELFIVQSIDLEWL